VADLRPGNLNWNVRRILVVHFDPLEAVRLAERVRREGFETQPFSERVVAGFRSIRANPPEAILIDLARMPSYGRYIGALLRENQATRTIPLVFLKGEPEKTRMVKTLLPGAVFTSLSRLQASVERAILRKPVSPARPQYAAVPAVKKLGIKTDSKVTLRHAPDGFTLELPEGARFTPRGSEATVVLIFARSIAALGREMPLVKRSTEAGKRLWLLWPKKASGQSGDLSLIPIIEMCKAVGLAAYKTCAVDDVWSGLAVGKARRPA
jgi:CheY-like chemotaxis protein